MDGYYERNLFFLKKRQPELARALSLQNCEGAGADAGRSGEKDACADRTDPERSLHDPVLYIIGLVQTDLAASYLKRLPPHVRFVVLLEPDPLLLTSFLDTVPVFDILASRICVFATSEDSVLLDEAVAAAFGHSGFLVGRCASSVHFGDDESDRSARSASLANAFERSLSFQIENLGNSPEDSLLGLRQMALSSPWTLFAQKLRTLEGRFGNWPAVIVSAGPSLDKNLHLLKGRENEIVIIAVDTVLGKLLKNGIVPHFVTALERGTAVYDYHFRGVLDEHPPELKNIVLVVQSVCVPRIAGRWPGPVIVVGKRDIVLDREIVGGLLDGSVIPSGASVAHMGLGLASVLGCFAVALIGQDLAFANDGKSHTTQTPWEKSSNDMKTPREERLRVPAVDGGTVETTRIWRYFIDQFTRMSSAIHVPLYDCTEGGSLIPGTVVLELSRFIAGNAPMKPAEKLSLFPKRLFDDSSSRNFELEAFDRRYLTLHQSFRDSQQEIDRALGFLRMLEAPVLTAQRRDLLVWSVRMSLNKLAATAPILTYLGQAEFAALISDNYRFRDVSDKPILMQWIARHRSFLENQAVCVRMIIGWLLYIDGVRQMSEVILSLMRSETPEEMLSECLSKRTEGTFREAITVDVLLARVEPEKENYPRSVHYAAAQHYVDEKRFEEAERLFEFVSTTFQAESLDIDNNLRWATCIISGDLCWRPDFEKARRILARINRQSPDRREVDALCVQLLRIWRKALDRLLRLHGQTRNSCESRRLFLLKENIEGLLESFSRDADEAKRGFLAPSLRIAQVEGAE